MFVDHALIQLFIMYHICWSCYNRLSIIHDICCEVKGCQWYHIKFYFNTGNHNLDTNFDFLFHFMDLTGTNWNQNANVLQAQNLGHSMIQQWHIWTWSCHNNDKSRHWLEAHTLRAVGCPSPPASQNFCHWIFRKSGRVLSRPSWCSRGE